MSGAFSWFKIVQGSAFSVFLPFIYKVLAKLLQVSFYISPIAVMINFSYFDYLTIHHVDRETQPVQIYSF